MLHQIKQEALLRTGWCVGPHPGLGVQGVRVRTPYVWGGKAWESRVNLNIEGYLI